MSELSKQALKVQNNTEFPNNNAGLITPSKLRGFNTDMIDSLVDEISYNVDSASWNQQIDSLEGFTASLANTFVNTASFNAYTQSNDQRVTSLEVNSASVNVSITNINSFTSSQQSFNASATASIVELLNLSSSLSGGYVTQGELADATGSLINSINTKLDTASFNSYTASTDSSISQLNASSASQQISINALNTNSASVNTSISNLNSATASLFTSASLGLTTASFNNGTRDLTFSKGDGTQFAVNIPDVSGSAGNFVTTSSFNAYTQSNDQRVSSLEANSASVNTSISNLNSATSSLFTSASLGLTTASVNLNVLTLRKGDGTTFNLTVDTGSGQAVPQGTISSSAQITALGFVSSSVTASSLITASISGQLITFTKGNGNTFNLTLPSSSTSLVTSSYGAFSDTTTQSGSANTAYPFKFNSVDIIDGVTLSGSTGLQVDASGVYNIQFSAQVVQGSGVGITNIWFRKNNVDIPNSDTSITVGSNSRLVAAWNIFSTASAGDNFEIIWKSDSANTTFAFISGSGTSPNIPSIIATVNRIDIGGNAPTPAGTVSSSAQILAYGIFATTGSNTFNGTQTVTGSVNVNNDIKANGYVSASVFQGPDANLTQATIGTLNAGNGVVSSSAQITALGFVSSSVTGSSLVTASVTLNTITFTKGDASTFQLTVDTGSGGGGTAFANPSVESISGSLVITANTFTSGAANLTHISASAQNQANLVFKNNNNTASTIVSGSNNIYVNPQTVAAGRINYIGGTGNIILTNVLPTITGSATSVSGNRPTMNSNILGNAGTWTINQSLNPGTHAYSGNIIEGGSATFNMLGNTGNVTYSNNIALGVGLTLNSPSRSIAEINAGASGSNALNIQSNLIQGTFNYNGPVSSSTHTVSNNAIAGAINLNIQSGSRGYTIIQNNINGNFAISDNTVNAPTLGSTHTFNNNIVNGTVIYNNRASSSFQSNSNIWNGMTVSSDWDGSAITTATLRLLSVNQNIGFGLGNNIYASGSQGAIATRRVALYNLIGGEFISASLVGDGEGKSMIATTILGAGLNVSGSSTIYNALSGQSYGSAFFGRWNAEDGNRAKTAETIFAVGTGNSGSAGIVRKTGFLIDSGSNTFIEGTLNVSGSTSFTGSAPRILSGSFSGSLITNLTDTYTDVSAVNQIVTLTSASYAALVTGSLTNPNTLYIVSGSTQVNPTFPYTGSAIITGSLVLTGSAQGNVVSASISSNTASIDFNLANYFELTSSVTPLHLNITNPKPGTTSTLIISASASSSITFSPNVAQPSGSAYSGSLGSIDILSLVAFSTSKVNVVSTKALV
jgi:hypothetical protein